MDQTRAYEREIERLEKDLNDGLITDSEYQEEMEQLTRDYRDAAAEAAQDAYERELDDWNMR